MIYFSKEREEYRSLQGTERSRSWSCCAVAANCSIRFL